MYIAKFSDDFNEHFKKLTKKDGTLKKRLVDRIEEMKVEKPTKALEYVGDLKGKWKERVGDYRLPYAYCEDCLRKGYENMNKCYGCESGNDDIVFFDVFHRSKGYEE